MICMCLCVFVKEKEKLKNLTDERERDCDEPKNLFWILFKKDVARFHDQIARPEHRVSALCNASYLLCMCVRRWSKRRRFF